MTTKQRVEERIEWTTGQHTRWLYFDSQRCAWFNGSDFVCQMSWHETDDEGEGVIMSWAPAHQLEGS